jgi:hypothetical protein
VSATPPKKPVGADHRSKNNQANCNSHLQLIFYGAVTTTRRNRTIPRPVRSRTQPDDIEASVAYR